ncbi:MAG: SBBP repeat-containing protein [bacterium]
MNKRLLPVFGILLSLVTVASAGDTIWTRRYDGPANGDEEVCALFTDAERNVIVVGSSPGTTTGYDIVVFKYAANGDSIWCQRINGSGASNEFAKAAAIDASGSVYVTGRAGASGDYNILTVKLNPDGSEAWRATYQGSAGKNDEPLAMAIDASGNVFVAGYEADPGGSTDFVTIKYNADGNQSWVANFDGGVGDDRAVAIAIGSDGSVYVTGSSTQQQGTFQDYATVKYNSGGGQEWAALYDRDGVNDIPVAIAVDDAGNVYVTGRSAPGPPPGGVFSYGTVKYGSGGTRLWVKLYGATGRGAEPAAMVLGSSGLFITGKVVRSGSYDIGTIGYNPNTGDTLWVRVYNGLANNNDVGNAITVDGSGRVHVLGSSQDTLARDDYLRLRYSSGGILEMVARYNSPFNKTDQGLAIAVDNEYNVVVTGRSYGGMPIMTYDIWTVKSDSAVPGVEEAGFNQARTSVIKAQPNPARTITMLNLNLTGAGAAELILWDVTGSRCQGLKVHLPIAGNLYPLSLDGLNPGVYLLEARLPGRSERLKLQIIE